jgi:hypothetical protein
VPARLPLNPLDVALCCVDRTIRGMHYPGFETQLLLWLDGRADVERLQIALTRLGRIQPVITARLHEDLEGDGSAWWECRPDERPALAETDLDSPTQRAVLDWAGVLLSLPRDPAEHPPLRFHLAHLPDGRDVFLMQYNHVLMDNTAPSLVVRELHRLSQPSPQIDPVGREPRHVLLGYLRRFSHAQRQSAAAGAISMNGRVLRGRAAILGKGEEDASLIYQGPVRAAAERAAAGPRPLKLAARSLEPAATRAIHARSVRLCGLPSLSMAILASALRGIGRLGPQERNAGRNYVAGIGLDLGLRRGGMPLFQNLLSLVPLGARPEELADRDELVRRLSGQLRGRLEDRLDLGIVRLAVGFRHRVRYMQWALSHMLRYSYSLWYAYFGALDGLGPELCGRRIENAFYVGPTWSPMGIGMLASQFGERLNFQLTYDPYLVDDHLAKRFLDFVLQDVV